METSSLFPMMPLNTLIAWAQEHRVEYALTYPAKMLLVPTSKIHTNWLWVYQQNNTSIQEIITRPSAYSLDDTNAETAPLEFQTAAIEYLYELIEHAKIAELDEQNLLKSTPPSNPILAKIWTQLLISRSAVRRTIQPRSKHDRRTHKIWLDIKNHRLQYKEDSIAWCGEGNWAELYIYLDGRSKPVSCTCLKGRNGSCRLGLSALDQTLEVLIDPIHTPLQERIISSIGTPKWQHDFTKLDALLRQEPISREGELLGWRVKDNKGLLEVEAVWCIHSTNGWKHRRADLEEIGTNTYAFPHPYDPMLLELLTSSKPLAVSSILHLLQEHPRVFIGTKSSCLAILSPQKPSLYFSKEATGIEWSFRLGEMELPVLSFLNSPSVQSQHIWFRAEESELQYFKFNLKFKQFIQTLSTFTKIFPSDANAVLYQKLSGLSSLIPISLDDTLRGKPISSNNRPVIRVMSTGEHGLRLEFMVYPITDTLCTIGDGLRTIYHFNHENQTFGYCARNFEEEHALADTLRKYLGLPLKENYQWVITEAAKIFAILSALKDLPNGYYNRIEWLTKQPKIQHLNLQHLSLDILDHPNHIELTGGLDGEDGLLSFWDVLPAIRRNEPYLLVKGHVWYSIEADFRRKLTLLADMIQPTKQHLNIGLSHLQTLNELLPIESKPLTLQTKSRSIQPVRMSDAEFAYNLRDYQKHGVEWMLQLKHWAAGCLLADEMGLGKTIQTIRFLFEIQDVNQNKTIIIAPKSTLSNWQKELSTCLPDWSIVLYQGQNRDEQIDTLFPKQCLLMTYEIMCRDIEKLLEFHYNTIVFDEAQSMKNPHSSRHQSAQLLTADFKIALTGTPIENSLMDLWSIVQIVLPNHLGTVNQFKKRFLQPIETGQHSRLQDLQTLLQPFLLRRRKEDVAKDLPEKIELNHFITLSSFELDTYEQLKREAKQILKENPEKARFLILPVLTKLRQVCCHRGLVMPSASDHSSKLEHALEIILNLQQQHRKVLVFSQFVQLLHKFENILQKQEINYCYLDGNTAQQKRQDEIDRFQEGDIDVFLISLKAGGSGINLSSATEVIHLDPWWNPAVEDQASDRAHRIGQTQTVTIIRLLAQDTIETQILKLQQEKKKIATDLFSESLSTLSIQEIEALLD